MKARHLFATLTLALAAGAAFAAFQQTSLARPQARPVAVADCEEAAAPAIPRVVVTAKRVQAAAAEVPVARVVVTAKRSTNHSTVAVAR